MNHPSIKNKRGLKKDVFLQSKMRLAYLVVLLGLVTVVVSASTYFLFAWNSARLPPNSTAIPYLFTVADALGVDAGTDIFRLGKLMPGTSSQRTLLVTDPFAQSTGNPHEVRVWARGEGSEWLVLTPASGITPIDVVVTLTIPEGAAYGEYRGELIVEQVSK